MAETVDATKTRYGEAEALALLDGIDTLIAAKGKKVETFDLKNDRPDDADFTRPADGSDRQPRGRRPPASGARSSSGSTRRFTHRFWAAAIPPQSGPNPLISCGFRLTGRFRAVQLGDFPPLDEVPPMDVMLVLVALGIYASPAEDTFEQHANIAYRTDKDADPERHLLDVYVPKGKKDFPVVLFVHGGSWKSGNKNLYAPLGQSLAADGIGCVICNYRLSPAVQHPAHVEDVAKAFAWTVRQHRQVRRQEGASCSCAATPPAGTSSHCWPPTRST